MKTLCDFLRRHSLLLLAALIVLSVPAGVALGKYVKNVEVTKSLSVKIDTQPSMVYTHNLNTGSNVNRILKNSIETRTKIKFCRTPPSGANVVDSVNLGADTDDNIQLWEDSDTLYITPNDATSVMVFNEDCSKMLSGLKVTNIYFDNDAIDTSKVKNMCGLIYNCQKLLDITFPSSFDTSSVDNMSQMFTYCYALSNISFGENFKTSNVKTMMQMFNSCEALSTIDLSGFDFSNVTSLKSFLDGCKALTNIQFPTVVKTATAGCSMKSMFSNCQKLETLDLSAFYTSNVTDMSFMFSSSQKLKTIYASEYFVVSGAKCSYMFGGGTTNIMDSKCKSLVGGAGTECKDRSSPVDGTYARIDHPPTFPGYFTDINATRSLTYSATGTDKEANGFGLAFDLAS